MSKMPAAIPSDYSAVLADIKRRVLCAMPRCERC